jgi:hypothetical protein
MKPGWLYTTVALVLLIVGFVVLMIALVDGARDRRVRAKLLEPVGLLLMACGTLVLALLMMIRGWFWIPQVLFVLLTGWVRFLGHVSERVQPDAWAVASALVCAAAAAAGAHLFLRWLAASASRPWPLKRTLQMLLLVALAFASGLAVAGLVQQTGWLIRTPDPLVKDSRQLS